MVFVYVCDRYTETLNFKLKKLRTIHLSSTFKHTVLIANS